MQRRIAPALVLAAVAALSACGGAETNKPNVNTANSNSGNPPRDGAVDANVKMPANTNANSVSSNTGVVTNDNGNANTSGVKTMNDNRNSNSKNGNTKPKPE